MDDWLEQRLKGEAKRRLWLWLLGGGLVTAGPILGIVLIVIVAAVFLGGFGSGIPGPVTGTSPPMGTSTARAIEWLPAVDASAPGLPNALGLAVIAQASGGAVYGDRSYCVQGTQEQSSGLRCRSALGHGWKKHRPFPVSPRNANPTRMGVIRVCRHHTARPRIVPPCSNGRLGDGTLVGV